MTTTNPESANGANGAAETPTPPVSNQPSGQQTSSVPFVLDDAAVEKLIANPKFEEHLTRKFQSAKDRRIGNLEQAVADLKSGKGTPAQVQQAVVELEGNQSPTNVPGRTAVAAQGDGEFKKQTADLLAKAGIPANDPELIELAKAEVASPTEWFLKVGQLAAKRAASASSGSVAVDASGTSAGSGSKEERRANLSKQLNALINTPGRKDMVKLASLQAELRALT